MSKSPRLDFRRPPWLAFAAAAVTAVGASLALSYADSLNPIFRGAVAAGVLWGTVLAVWEVLVPYVRIEKNRLTLKPGLLLGSSERALDDLTGTTKLGNKIQLRFDRSEPLTIKLSRVSGRQREQLLKELKKRTPEVRSGSRTKRKKKR